jgi:hypothetical protein
MEGGSNTAPQQPPRQVTGGCACRCLQARCLLGFDAHNLLTPPLHSFPPSSPRPACPARLPGRRPRPAASRRAPPRCAALPLPHRPPSPASDRLPLRIAWIELSRRSYSSCRTSIPTAPGFVSRGTTSETRPEGRMRRPVMMPGGAWGKDGGWRGGGRRRMCGCGQDRPRHWRSVRLLERGTCECRAQVEGGYQSTSGQPRTPSH